LGEVVSADAELRLVVALDDFVERLGRRGGRAPALT